MEPEGWWPAWATSVRQWVDGPGVPPWVLDGYTHQCDDVGVLEEWLSLWQVYTSAATCAQVYRNGMTDAERKQRALQAQVQVRTRAATIARHFL